MKNASRTLMQRTLLAVALGALGAAEVGAQTTSTTTAPVTKPATDTTALSKLIAQYSQWAGSKENAKSLVRGLNAGTPVTLNGTGSATPSTFTPATSKLGVGEVNIALSLAKASLAQQGITNLTPAQLSAALNGGVVTSSTSTTSLTGVLTQRQAGSGWGQIAHALGIKLGAVVSASKTDKSKAGAEHKSEHTGHKNKTEDSQRSEHAHHSESNASGRSGQGGGNSGGGAGGKK
jgi:hypothetical protein